MGLEYSRQLVGKGYRVVIVSNRQDQLDDAVRSLNQETLKQSRIVVRDDVVQGDGNIIPHYADLAAPEAAESLHSWCNEQGLEIDTLVCNAGMFFFKELQSEDEIKVDTMLNLHVKTNTDLCLLFGEDMKKRGGGHIILMSSMAAKLPTPGITVYSATKAYLLSFGKSLWFEMRPYGVSVTTVCPAAIATPLYNLKPSLMKLGVRTGIIHTPKWLVRKALRASEHGRKLIRPSAMNWYLPGMVALLPAPVEGILWRKLK